MAATYRVNANAFSAPSESACSRERARQLDQPMRVTRSVASASRSAIGLRHRREPADRLGAGAAYGALRQLGFGETESKHALARVRSLGGPGGTLEGVIRLALAELTTGSA